MEHTVLYTSDNFADSGTPTPVIKDSARAGGLKRLVNGPTATTGTPDVDRRIDLGANHDEITVVFEVYLDYDDTATGSNGDEFLNWFGMLTSTGGVAFDLGQITTGRTGVKITGATWYANPFSSNHIAGRTATMVKVHYLWNGSTGTWTTSVKVAGVWTQVSQVSHTNRPRILSFICRPLVTILAEGPAVEFGKLAIAFDGEDVDWSDLVASAQLRGQLGSGAGINQSVLVQYQEAIYGTPAVDLHAEVQMSTDETFATGVEYGSVELTSANDWLANVTVSQLDPLSTIYWRVRFVDGGTFSGTNSAITGGTELLLTDSASFPTTSINLGTPATSIRIAFGTCAHHNDAHTPIETFNAIEALDPHWYVCMDDQYYADLSMNGLTDAENETPGAVRAGVYEQHARASLWLMHPFARIAGKMAVIGSEGNHIVDSQFPGFSTPSDSSLVADALPAFDKYWLDGQLGKGPTEVGARYMQNATAKCSFFFANCLTYDNDGGSFGPEGRDMGANPKVLLGESQMADLLQAIDDFSGKFFFLMCSVAFANDAATPGTAGVGWALANGQRQEVINHFLANAPPDAVLITTGGHWHFPVVTRQGLPDTRRIAPYIGAAPISRFMPSNYDSAYLDDYDGGPIFKSDLGAAHTNSEVVQCFGYFDINEETEVVTYSIRDGSGAVLHTGTIAAFSQMALRNRINPANRRSSMHLGRP